MSSSLEPKLNLNNSFGALLLGTILSAVLYGVMGLQSWHYYQNYSDGPLLKSAVGILLILESLHTAAGTHATYYYLVMNYANPPALLKAVWSVGTVVAVTTLARCIVHVFYLRRVYIVSQQKVPLVAFTAALALTCVGTGLACSILTLKLAFFSDFLTVPTIYVPAYISLALPTVVDILIAGSLSFFLYTRKTGISNTDKVVDRLVVHTVNNGIITGVAGVLCLIFALADKNSMGYLAIYNCIGHLYSNTMLSTLNSRQTMNRLLPTSIDLSGPQTLEFRATAHTSIMV